MGTVLFFLAAIAGGVVAGIVLLPFTKGKGNGK